MSETNNMFISKLKDEARKEGAKQELEKLLTQIANKYDYKIIKERLKELK